MTDTNEAPLLQSDVNFRVVRPTIGVDLVTILSLVLAIGVVVVAIIIGDSNAKFFNVPSLLIVVCGTIFVTSMSYTGEELGKMTNVLGQSFVRKIYSPRAVARELMDLAMISRKSGLLALSGLEPQLRSDKHLAKAVQIVTDGYAAEDVGRVLSQDLDSLVERHRRSANILRRGAEVAPAMGLIGTLVGLVQMLADLQNPETIGPAMAVALLTTFYGALLGTVVLGPLAAKLERNSNQESLIRSLIMHAMVSIAAQDNPRRLEMILNSELPPHERIRYFD